MKCLCILSRPIVGVAVWLNCSFAAFSFAGVPELSSKPPLRKLEMKEVEHGVEVHYEIDMEASEYGGVEYRGLCWIMVFDGGGALIQKIDGQVFSGFVKLNPDDKFVFFVILPIVASVQHLVIVKPSDP